MTTAANTFNYELNGANNRSSVLNVINDTSNWEMKLKESAWFDQQFLLNDPQNGAPIYYNFNGVSSDGDVQVDIFPVPDGVYTLRFNMVLRNDDLTADSDTVVVPTRPIILLATGMAIEERGEDGGQQSINAYQMGQNALADEIAFDDARSPEGTIWYTA